jgi:putative inorganic carbon (hco3(-)) transporter
MIQLISVTVFLIYMNVPVVLVSEHGVPRPLALLVPLLLAVPVAYRVLLRGEALRVPGMIIAALVMLACHALSALLSERPDIGLESVFSWLLEGVLLAFLLVNALRSRDEVFAAARAIVAAGALMGLLVLLQQILGPREFDMAGFGQLSVEAEDPERVQYRLSGPIGEQNRFAQVLAVLIPLSAGLAFAAAARQRWLYWIATALIFAGVLLTFSRGTLVALVLVLPFALVFGFLRLRHLAVAAICCALLLAVLPFMIAMPYFAERVASIGHVFVQLAGMAPGGLRNTDGASRGRITSMQATGLIFLDHPLLGAGPGMAAQNYGEYAQLVGGKVRTTNRRAHNLYLEQAAETGVVGLLALLGVLWMVLHALNDTRRRTQYNDRELWGLVCGLQLGVLVYMTTSLFLHASYVRYFWLLLGLAVAAATIPRPQMLAELLSLVTRVGLGRLQLESSAMAADRPGVSGGSA